MKKKILSTVIILSCFSFANGQVFELQENTSTVSNNNSIPVSNKTIKNIVSEEDEVILDNSNEDIIIPAEPVIHINPWMNIVQSKNRDYSLIEKTLQNGQNANQVIFDGSNMLHLAAWQNDAKLFRLGLEYGAILSNTNKNGETALHWAAYSKNPHIINMALADKSILKVINKQNKFGRTPLHFNALQWGNLDVAKALIAQKADLNIQDNYGQTPLHYALSSRKWSLAKLYIDSGADISIKDKSGDGIDEYILDKADVEGLLLFFKYLSVNNQNMIKARLASINVSP